MRVLRIITRLNVGGPTRHVGLLMEELPTRRQLLVSGPTPASEGVGQLSVGGRRLECRSLVRGLAPLSDLRAGAALRRIIRRFRPDVVHTHQSKAGAIGRLVAASEGVPRIVHTHHGLVTADYFGALGARLIGRVERGLARRSHALVVQAPSQAVALAERLPGQEAKIRVIPPALPAGLLKDAAEPQLADARRLMGGRPSAGGGLRWLLCARLAAIKRPLAALDLLAALHAAGRSEDQLFVLGEGPLGPAFDEHARHLGLAAHVHRLGWRADPRAFYATADRVLLTSASEGTPLALYEALAQGTRVVAPDVGGVREVIGKGGLVLGAQPDAEAWAGAVLRDQLTADGEEARLALRARQAEVRAEQSPLRLARELAALYTSLPDAAGGVGGIGAGSG